MKLQTYFKTLIFLSEKFNLKFLNVPFEMGDPI